MEKDLIKILKKFQRDEITEYYTYIMLSKIGGENNKDTLIRLAEAEYSHYEFFKQYTRCEIKPNFFRAKKNYFMAKYFGLTFGLKAMEIGEQKAQSNYKDIIKNLPEVQKILEDEENHEIEVVGLLKEERLIYVSSIILGLNDALIELTGALAGYTFALDNSKVIAMVGLITGIAASLSMGASEYLSSKSEKNSDKNHKRAAIYTGLTYMITVSFLVAPFLLGLTPHIALFLTLITAVFIIFVFNYYVAVATGASFKKRFFEMTFLSLGISTLSFIVGIAIKNILKVDS
ncbi:VIT1/CCC1 transporter family protein [uncultured Ilyobacter sp.]|uniref:VIT1/CCC1 transporter family protein n=1 Tax=uncultured Ilyobacter sp. TaxID=544433 RepID=UPI0029C79E4F|nr:VIT1/CCC1 transporter family protein [uncultured Ilyobacter sp.]